MNHPFVYHDASMDDSVKTQRKKKARYRRARVRNFLFTVGPSRLSGGITPHFAGKGVVDGIEGGHVQQEITPPFPRLDVFNAMIEVNG